MAEFFNFELVSPERLLVSEQVSEVVIPATDGEMTVLVNHAPVMTTIRPGIVSVKLASGLVQKYVVFGGFADVTQTSCTLLAESAVPVSEIDRTTLEKRIAAAQAELDDAEHHEHRSKLEQYLGELTHLNGVLAPA